MYFNVPLSYRVDDVGAKSVVIKTTGIEKM
jgi:hypothetical protein